MSIERKTLPAKPYVKAPDGSDVRILLKVKGGSMIHIELPAGTTSNAVAHKTVEELWYFLGGKGEIWQHNGDSEETVAVEVGTSISIPTRTAFQFRSFGPEPLTAICVTMPPWPGMDEAYEVEGRWKRV